MSTSTMAFQTCSKTSGRTPIAAQRLQHLWLVRAKTFLKNSDRLCEEPAVPPLAVLMTGCGIMRKESLFFSIIRGFNPPGVGGAVGRAGEASNTADGDCGGTAESLLPWKGG